TLSCTSVSCHGGGGPRYWSGAAVGGEYVHWLGADAKYTEGRRHYDPRARLEKTIGDPHAWAAQRMLEPRFQEVLRRASQREDGSVDASMQQRCAQCHDPLGLGSRAEEIDLPPVEEPLSSTTLTPALSQRESVQADVHGIGCESCHGGGRQWIAVHYQRDISREQLVQLGMIDTKNVLVRARQCAACHVGSAEQDMNHDMIAAGHPPLRFELASYEALLSKHWDDRPRRAVEPAYEVQLWAAGRIAAADAALTLLESRARRSAEEGDRSQGPSWPEFAESNCLACHQPLRPPAGKAPVVSSGRTPSAIAWQSWNTALVGSVVFGNSLIENERPPQPFGKAAGNLRAAMEQSLEPLPAAIASLAASARAALRQSARVDSGGRILDRHGRPLHAGAALQVEPFALSVEGWDEACQQVAALVAAERTIGDAGQNRGSGVALPDDRRWSPLHERILRVGQSLRFIRDDRQWPAALAETTAGTASPAMTMTQISHELEALRRELMTTVSSTIRP
ncbi:MAG TPA: hypothetical protein VKH44_03330, partial [Pirellulaceae bacterium]|nr:hypothetical protein [Pirellulaceae bacterium]